MQTLNFDTALLPEGWARQVAITIDDRGNIADVSTNQDRPRLGNPTGCALPGMPNLHSHAHQRAMAGLTEYVGSTADSFWSWREVMYRYVARITPRHLESIATQLYMEMLKAGYTTVAEFQYLHHDPEGKAYDNPAEMSLATCAAANQAGIGMTSLPVLYGFSDFGSIAPLPGQRRFVNDSDSYLRIVGEIFRVVSNDPNTELGVAPHSLRAIDKALLDNALNNDLPSSHPIHIHIAEQTREVDACIAWSQQRPVEWLLAHYDVNQRWCLIHATHMSDDEASQFACTGAVAGLCPTTEANLGDGFFNAGPYLARDGRFGIGSDSHVSIDPVEELRWLEYGQRLLHRSRNVLAPARMSSGRFLMERALEGGAQACARKIGKLQQGYRADLIVVDNDHPLLYGRNGDAILDSLIFAGNVNLVRDVFVGGRKVIAGGTHPDEDRITANFKSTLTELAL